VAEWGAPPQSPYAPPPYAPPPAYGPQSPHAPQSPYAPPPYAASSAQAGRRRAEIPTGGPVTDEDERWAVPAYIGMFVTGFVAPVLVYVLKGRSSMFARFHAAQALNLFIAMSACNVAAYLLTYEIGMTGLLITLLLLAAEAFCVIRAAIGANRYEWYRLPSIIAWPIVR
jgi:uncharacterized membrane protein